MYTLHLPKEGKKELSGALRRLLDDAKRARNVSAVEWFITRHYLQGCRYFETIEYDLGLVRPSYRNSAGGVPFKYEELINKFNTEVGRIMRLDTSPAVVRKAVGLDGLRQESVAQVVLDAINPYLMPERLKRYVCQMVVEYGPVGLLAYEDPDMKKGPEALGIEVVPPWELLVLPATARGPAEIAGTARQRWVSVDWLKTIKIGGKPVSGISDLTDIELEIRHLPQGSTVSESYAGSDDGSAGSSGIGGSPAGASFAAGSYETRKEHTNAGATGVPWGRLSETWIPYKNGRLARYLVMVGRKIIWDKSYENTKESPMYPIGYITRSEGIGVYGRSFIAPLITVNCEVEASALRLLKNVQDFDMFGAVGIPSGMQMDQADLDAALAGRGSRYFRYETDPTDPNQRLEHLQPMTSGTMPKDILNMGFMMLDRLGQQPEIVTEGSAPGRVDSTPALNFLYQASTLPLGGLASGFATAFGTAYKALLGFAAKWPAITLNLEALTDDTVIGIAVEPGSGKMKLGNNALPDPVELDVGIRSQKPLDTDKRKAELMQLLQAGIVSQAQFRLTSRLEQLDFPIRDDTEWQNYRMAILRNIVLFNDGKTPGDLTGKMAISQYDLPEIHLMVINRLMASPEFALASDEVQTKFGDLAQEMRARSGQYPEQMPAPEEMGSGPGAPEGMGDSGALGDMGGQMGSQQGGDMSSMLQQLSGLGGGADPGMSGQQAPQPQ